MRVLVCDDDSIVRQSLATILGAEEDIEVVATGADGNDAVRLYRTYLPDIALIDIRMPLCDGLDGAAAILKLDTNARIVFLTTFADDEYIVRALRLGARGYLIKQDVSSIALALRAVMAGQSVLEDEILERATLLGKAKHQPDGSLLKDLTEREHEVMRAVSNGFDNAEIATALHISEGTVRNHISAILAKLHLRNRTQIAVFYYRHQI